MKNFNNSNKNIGWRHLFIISNLWSGMFLQYSKFFLDEFDSLRIYWIIFCNIYFKFAMESLEGK